MATEDPYAVVLGHAAVVPLVETRRLPSVSLMGTGLRDTRSPCLGE